MMFFDSPRELVARWEALTTPDSEDWTIIPDGKVIHGTAFHEDTTPAGNRVVSMCLFKISKAELKDIVRSLPKADCRPLGRITIHLCTDHMKMGADDLIEWLVRMSKHKGFSVAVIAGPASTAQALAAHEHSFRADMQRDPSRKPN